MRDTYPVSGRPEQLGRQLRRLRAIAGNPRVHPPGLTLSRATHLALDIACELSEQEGPRDAFAALATRGIVEPVLAERLATWVESKGIELYAALKAGADRFEELVMPIARDLDRFLRSVELASPAPEVPFDELVKDDGLDDDKPSSRAAVTIVGRVVELAERSGRATITIDDRPIAVRVPASDDRLASFPLACAPRSRPEVHSDRAGFVAYWELERLSIRISPDLASVMVETGVVAPVAKP